MENREMQTSNTAEMVTISRAEYERFQEQTQGFPKLKDTTTKPTLTLLPSNTILEVKPYEMPCILRV